MTAPSCRARQLAIASTEFARAASAASSSSLRAPIQCGWKSSHLQWNDGSRDNILHSTFDPVRGAATMQSTRGQPRISA